MGRHPDERLDPLTLTADPTTTAAAGDLDPGYRYPASVVDALAAALVERMTDETLYGDDPAVHARLSGGYVLRDDPRALAQDMLDHLAPLVATALEQGARQARNGSPLARDLTAILDRWQATTIPVSLLRNLLAEHQDPAAGACPSTTRAAVEHARTYPRSPRSW